MEAWREAGREVLRACYPHEQRTAEEIRAEVMRMVEEPYYYVYGHQQMSLVALLCHEGPGFPEGAWSRLENAVVEQTHELERVPEAWVGLLGGLSEGLRAAVVRQTIEGSCGWRGHDPNAELARAVSGGCPEVALEVLWPVCERQAGGLDVFARSNPIAELTKRLLCLRAALEARPGLLTGGRAAALREWIRALFGVAKGASYPLAQERAGLLRWFGDEFADEVLGGLSDGDLPWEVLARFPHGPSLERALGVLVKGQPSNAVAEGVLLPALLALREVLGARLPGLVFRAAEPYRGVLLRAMLQTVAPGQRPEAARACVEALGGGREANRQLATEGLLSLGKDAGLPAVREGLGSKRKRIREGCARLLQRWAGDPEVTRIVRGALVLEKDAEVAAALRLVGEGASDLGSLWGRLDDLRRGHGYSAAELKERRAALTEYPSRDAWRSYMGEGERLFVVLLEELTEGSQWGWTRQRAQYEARRVLQAMSEQPLAVVVALECFELQEGESEVWLEELRGIFGERLVEPAVLALRRRKLSKRRELYAWLCTQPQAPCELHLDALEDDAAWMRELAARTLAERPEQVKALLPRLIERLGASKAASRFGAATLLRRVGLKEALPALEAALAKEKAKDVREELEQARAACDPFLAARRVRASCFGAYRWREDALTLNEGMEELRALVYEAPSALAWVRLLNLLERLRAVGGWSVAADYVRGYKVKAWPDECKPHLWRAGYEDDAELCELLGARLSDPESVAAHRGEDEVFHVLSLARLAAPEPRARYLDEFLPGIETRIRKRRFDRADVEVFLDAVERGWMWCEEQGIPPDHLEVRVDGGSVTRGYMASVDVASLELVAGFGARVGRQNARKEDVAAEHGLRFLRCRIPKKHPLREQHKMTPAQRYLDL
jgi:hypothetical protein